MTSLIANISIGLNDLITPAVLPLELLSCPVRHREKYAYTAPQDWLTFPRRLGSTVSGCMYPVCDHPSWEVCHGRG